MVALSDSTINQCFLDEYPKNVIFPLWKKLSSHVSKYNRHEVSASACLLADPYLSGDYYANDGPTLNTPEPLPAPAPPKNFGGSDQVLFNAAKHAKSTKPSRYPIYPIPHDFC